MKTNILKTGILLTVFTLLFTFSVNAQEEKTTTYYYATATALIDGQLKAIVGEVKYASCKDITPYSLRVGIKNQFHTYLEAELKYWYEYDIIVFDYANRGEAEKRRMEAIADYKSDDYHVTKDVRFKYYCD